MTSDIESVSACPLCGSAEQDDELQQPDALFPTGILRLVRCRGCGLVFLNPRLSRDAMLRLEDASPVYELRPEEVEREIQARIGLLRSFPKRESGGRLLDVGCNRGLLLAAALRLGWEPTGVEVSAVAAEKARAVAGASVYSDLQDVPRGDGFDLIVAWHVLEHTEDPKAFLVQTRSLLSPTGVLAIQVPSYAFVSRFREQGRIASIVCAVHNIYFTKSTLDGALRRTGFEQRVLIESGQDLMLTTFAELQFRFRSGQQLVRWRYLTRRAAAKLTRRP